MNDSLNTIHDVDVAYLATEKARLAIEAAKVSLELAKQDAEAARLRLEESLARAEELGFPRAKLRKVAEERANALLTSGLLKDEGVSVEKPALKAAKAPRRAKAVEVIESEDTPTKAESDWADDRGEAPSMAEAAI